MKKLKKSLLAVMLMGIMTIFAGCGSDFDAQGLVQSYMELITTGESEQYCELTDSTPEEASAVYQEMVDEIQSAFDMVEGLDAETTEKLTTAFVQLLSKAQYEVSEATKVDDGYELTLSIMPIQGAFAGFDDESFAAEIEEQFTSNPDMTEADLYNFVFGRMADIMTENMENLTYGDAQTIDLKVIEEDGYYVVEDEEDVFEQIGMMIIDYTDIQ